MQPSADESSPIHRFGRMTTFASGLHASAINMTDLPPEVHPHHQRGDCHTFHSKRVSCLHDVQQPLAVPM